LKLEILNVQDVAERQMCVGCGACAYIDPTQVEMVDVLDQGRRPLLRASQSLSLPSDALNVCPGIRLEHTYDMNAPGLQKELAAGWGPVLDVWEGYATDKEIRFAGSSGGAATAISLYCIERGTMHGVLHVAGREDIPYLNQAVLSRTREELLRGSGSRYAPASPCEGLQSIEDAPAECVFIGKPCDVAATRKAMSLRPCLRARIGLTIGIFCAGTPSTRGTFEMLRAMGIENPEDVKSLRYRGNGWPGNATAISRTGRVGEMTYEKSWNTVLTQHMQWRCRICPDHTGEFADIAVGDPWYRPIRSDNPGESLIVVRTERGREILRQAVANGYLYIQPRDPKILPASQPALLKTRGNVWARILVSRLLGAATPTYKNFALFRFWYSELSLKQKMQSIFGSAKRVLRKGLRHRLPIAPATYSGANSFAWRSPREEVASKATS
jgi:coenzyme F420 hydrogenase subunit beta